jgi:GMP synthase-like glutamine amidotransferase
MKALFVQNCGIEGPGLVGDWCRGRGVACDVVHAWRGDPMPDARAYDLVVVGGTPGSANDMESAFLAGVVRGGRPYLGICAGGQFLARLLGARVTRNPVLEIGGYEVRRVADDPCLRGFPPTFPVFQWHGETFDVPEGATLLVEGDDCRNQAFRKGNALALQFHLEVTCGDAAAWADAYAHELARIGKTKEQVVAECRSREPAMRALLGRLLDNFTASR